MAIQNADNTHGVASAVEEQTASFEEVFVNINAISGMASELNRIVQRFKIW